MKILTIIKSIHFKILVRHVQRVEELLCTSAIPAQLVTSFAVARIVPARCAAENDDLVVLDELVDFLSGISTARFHVRVGCKCSSEKCGCCWARGEVCTERMRADLLRCA